MNYSRTLLILKLEVSGLFGPHFACLARNNSVNKSVVDLEGPGNELDSAEEVALEFMLEGAVHGGRLTELNKHTLGKIVCCNHHAACMQASIVGADVEGVAGQDIGLSLQLVRQRLRPVLIRDLGAGINHVERRGEERRRAADINQSEALLPGKQLVHQGPCQQHIRVDVYDCCFGYFRICVLVEPFSVVDASIVN